MKLHIIILLATLPVSSVVVCQTAKQDSVSTFKVRKEAPPVKALYSKSNTLYEGENPLILEGVDSAHMGQYFLYTSKFIPIYKKDSRFYVSIGLYPISHDIITIPGDITVFIYKINGADTVPVGSQEMYVAGGELPRPTVMAGANPVTPQHERRKDLLANPYLSLISTNSDYNSCFKVSSVSITIGSITYTCKGGALSPEIIAALKKYHKKYVTINYVYVSSPDGVPVCFIGDYKK